MERIFLLRSVLLVLQRRNCLQDGRLLALSLEYLVFELWYSSLASRRNSAHSSTPNITEMGMNKLLLRQATPCLLMRPWNVHSLRLPCLRWACVTKLIRKSLSLSWTTIGLPSRRFVLTSVPCHSHIAWSSVRVGFSSERRYSSQRGIGSTVCAMTVMERCQCK